LSHKFVLAFVLVASVAALSPPLLARFEIPWLVTYFLALLIGVTLGVLLASPITRNFRSLRECTDRIAKGDLTAEIVVYGERTFPDETVHLARSVHTMLDSLRELVRHVQRAADRVAQSSKELSGSTQNLTSTSEEIAGNMELVARGATRQQQDVNAASKRNREIAGAIRGSADAARAAFGFVAESSHRAGSGLSAARQTTVKMQSLFEQVEQAGRLIFQFDEKIRSVRHITEVITSVAEKTHLLSLNASIEAARAGDAGRGFSVVADEIRRLAESAGRSAEQIDLLIHQVEDEAARISEVMRDLGLGVGEGREQLDTILGSLEQIQTAMQEAARRSEGIFDQADRQVDGTEDVVADIDRVASVASDNVRAAETMRRGLSSQAGAMEELVRHAEMLSQMSVELDQVARRFRTQ
jgi:methyl-accepting chemotaxis protein